MGQLRENSVPSGDYKRSPTMSKHCAERYSHTPHKSLIPILQMEKPRFRG